MTSSSETNNNQQSKAEYERRPTVLAGRWLFSFGDATPAMDRVHGLYLYRAPCLLLRRYVLALPAKIFGGRDPGRL